MSCNCSNLSGGLYIKSRTVSEHCFLSRSCCLLRTWHRYSSVYNIIKPNKKQVFPCLNIHKHSLDLVCLHICIFPPKLLWELLIWVLRVSSGRANNPLPPPPCLPPLIWEAPQLLERNTVVQRYSSSEDAIRAQGQTSHVDRALYCHCWGMLNISS